MSDDSFSGLGAEVGSQEDTQVFRGVSDYDEETEIQQHNPKKRQPPRPEREPQEAKIPEGIEKLMPVPVKNSFPEDRQAETSRVKTTPKTGRTEPPCARPRPAIV